MLLFLIKYELIFNDLKECRAYLLYLRNSAAKPHLDEVAYNTLEMRHK